MSTAKLPWETTMNWTVWLPTSMATDSRLLSITGYVAENSLGQEGLAISFNTYREVQQFLYQVTSESVLAVSMQVVIHRQLELNRCGLVLQDGVAIERKNYLNGSHLVTLTATSLVELFRQLRQIELVSVT